MAAVSVLVPWRGGDPHRERAWEHVSRWWAERHPGWQVVTGGGPDGPWRKAVAVADALGKADGDLLVVADADVLCDGVAAAVGAVTAGRAAWAMPHGMVIRLTEAASEAVYAGAAPDPAAVARPPYRGVEGGGLVVLPRTTYQRLPMDPRFVVWGQDDEAWALALNALAGRPWRGDAPLWHLWHPLAPRQTQRVGNPVGWALYGRYQKAARRGPDAMRQLIGEIANVEWDGATMDVLGPGWDDSPAWTGGATVRFESLKYQNLDLSNKPGLHGVRFVNGYCEVTRPNAVSILRSPYWQRRGIRVADDRDAATALTATPAEPTVVTYQPAPPPTEAPAAVPGGSANDVLAWVGNDADRAEQALRAEQGRDKPRTSLVAKLAKLAGEVEEKETNR